MRVRFLLAGLACVGLALISGCSGEAASAKSEGGNAPSGDGFKVALLTPGPVNDAGWSALAYEGLKSLEKDMGAEVANQEAAGSKIRDAMRSYAQKGYKLVFGHGYEYNEAGVDVAKDFPGTVFVSSSGGKTAANAGAFRFYLEQGFYLAGMLAAKVSKTGKIGSVAVNNYPSIVSTLKAYEAGAKAVNPDIQVLPTAYFITEGDVAKAKQATEQLIANGADVVIHQANAAAQGVFDACKEKNALALGSNANQNDNASGAVVASAYIVVGPAFLELAKQVKEGEFKGSVVLYGMEKGAIDFAINPSMSERVPADVAKLLDETKAKIKSGALTVPKDDF